MTMRKKRATNSKPSDLGGIGGMAAATVRAVDRGVGSNRAVFLDRDGVVNALVYHHEAGVIDSPFTGSQLRLLPRVPEAIRVLNELGFRVFIASNQPGIAKGHLRPAILKWFDRTMLSRIQAAGGHIDRTFYCLHHPEATVPSLRRRCHCRKPETGMLEDAASEFRNSLQESYMVGDGIPDILAGKRAGCKTIFVGRWKCEICQFTQSEDVRPSLVVKDLWDACQLLRSDIAAP